MGFGITPASGFPPPTPDEFPNFIQFRSGGENLGGPDADTLDFEYPLVATRGVGENANVVTVTSEGSGTPGPASGALDDLVVTLSGNSSGLFDGQLFGDWSGTVRRTSSDASWDPANNRIDLTAAGLYEVSVIARLSPVSAVMPSTENFVYYGSNVAESLAPQSNSRHAMSPPAGWSASTVGFAQWSDKYLVSAPSLPATITPRVYANAYQDEAQECDFWAMVVVRRLGDVTP